MQRTTNSGALIARRSGHVTTRLSRITCAFVALAAITTLGSGVSRAQQCVGDCDRSDTVEVNELVLGVNIALGVQPASTCQAFTNAEGAVDVAQLIAGVGNALEGCPVVIKQPTDALLVPAGPLAARIELRDSVERASVVIRLDDADVTGQFVIIAGVAHATFVVDPGEHMLTASADLHGMAVGDAVRFEAAALTNPYDCEALNDTTCLLPYPSSRFLVPDPQPQNIQHGALASGTGSGTGLRVALPAGGMPVQNGAPISPVPYNGLDGFNPAGPVLMHFRGSVDVMASNAPHLFANTRSYDARSLDDDSPTVLLDLDSGARVLHFVEVDARAADRPDRQVLFLYPSQALVPGHRYAVAVRQLLSTNGSPITAEAGFAALRDQRPTSIASLEARRADFERLFGALAGAGIVRGDLILAFDFVVRSDGAALADPLSMRAQAFDWLEQQISSGAELFTVDQVQDHDCAAPGTVYGREITGTYQTPLFLTVDPALDHSTPGRLTRGGDGDPSPHAFTTTNTPFKIAIPCAALVANRPLPACLIGHGGYSNASQWVGWLVSAANRGMPLPEAILGGTDWVGFTFADYPLTGAATVADLNLAPAAADRFLQAQLNAVVWARLMKRGVFNRHPAFQTANGTGAFAGSNADLCYWGSSLGGAEFALPVLAVSPDIGRALLDTPAILALFLQRTDAYPSVESTLMIDDPLQTALALNLANDLAFGNTPAYGRHITMDPLPGVNIKQVMFAPALFDPSVPNLSSEFLARTMGIPSLQGSIMHDRPGIPDQPGPLASALVAYDTGGLDINNPADAPFITPLTNLDPQDNYCSPHAPWPFDIPAVAQIALGFLQPGGLIENACNGLCDAGQPSEIMCGYEQRCDTSNPWVLESDFGCPAAASQVDSLTAP